MSIKAISWAWQQEAKSSHKFVLMAIADSANDFGEAQLSQSYLAWKTELSERVVRDALRALEGAGLMSRLRTVRRDGTRGVDSVVLHLERGSEKAAWKGVSEVRRQLAQKVQRDVLPAGEDHGPDVTLQIEADETPSQNHRQNLPVGGDYRQISPNLPADSAGRDGPGHLPTTRAPVFYPSSSSVGPAGPVYDDETMTTTDEQQSGSQVTRIHRGVNLGRLAAECSPAAGSWPEEVWAAAVDLVLGRAKSRVARPQRYVTGSIVNEPAVMLDAAERIAGSSEAIAHSLMTSHETNQQPVRRVSCPIHHADHREDRECAGCRADRLAQKPQEG